MYLTQRLIGIAVYVLITCFICLIISRSKGVNRIINIYVFLLALLGYLYVPMQGSDLTRTFSTMHLYSSMNFKNILETIFSHESPIVVLYYNFVGKFGNDKLLPCISVIITFSFIFFIVKLLYKNVKIKKKYLSLIIFYFMSRGLFMASIANIRTMISISIISFCIYKILCEKKSIIKYSPLLIVGALFHTVGIAALLIFMIYYVLYENNVKSKFSKKIQILVLIIIATLYGKDYILAAYNKGLNYLNYARVGNGYFYIWEMVLSLIVIIVAYFTLSKFKKRLYQNSDVLSDELNKYSSFLGFMKFLIVINFISIFIEFNIGLRLSYMLSILNIPLLMIICSSECYTQRDKANIYNNYLLLSILILFIACSRGDLCSYRFF